MTIIHAAARFQPGAIFICVVTPRQATPPYRLNEWDTSGSGLLWCTGADDYTPSAPGGKILCNKSYMQLMVRKWWGLYTLRRKEL